MIITIILIWEKYDSHAYWACGTDKAIAIICEDDSVMLCVEGRERNLFGGEADIPPRQERLTQREAHDLAHMVRQMIASPESTKTELGISGSYAHSDRTTPVSILILENGNAVFNWEGRASCIEGGLLRKIARLLRVG